MANEDAQIQEILNQAGEVDEGDATPYGGAGPSLEEVEKGRRLALEECLHSIANMALELEAGKRESITVEDLRVAFATHEVEEIWTEAQIFFGAAHEETDLDPDEGGEDDPNIDQEDGDEEED